MMSEEATGYFYMATRPTKGVKASEKMRLRKYDPVIRKHCWFTETKKS
jgi:large subunit ribosomal protein L33